MSDQATDNALGLAEKIVEDILKDPGQAERHKALLAETFRDVSILSAGGDKVEEVKSILTSKTFWGVVLGLVGQFGPKLGLHVSFLTTDQTDLIAQLVTVSGSAFAIYGRITAKSKITMTGK